MADLKFEFDSVAKILTFKGGGDNIQPIKLLNRFEYDEFCKIILSPSQFSNHRALMKDGLFKVSKKRYFAATEWLKTSHWRKPSPLTKII